MLALLIVPAFSTPALAIDLPPQNPLKMTLSQPTQEEIDLARYNDFKTIKVLKDNIDGSGNFAGIEWINQSNYANKNVTTKYKTIVFEFQIGPYKGHIDGAQFRTPGAPGQELIDKVTVTRESLIECYSEQGDREAVIEAIDTEAYLYIRAWIVIYTDNNGDGFAQKDEISEIISEKDQIDSKASMFPESNKADMRSRFQEVKINGSPDFYPTPEGEAEWEESFKECAKTYTGKPGDQITFPVNLYNVGAKATTDFKAVWEGQGDDPSTGWKGSNPPWQAGDPIELDKGEFKTFDVTVTIPDKATKLYFKSNTDGDTPNEELNTDNNIMAIVIQPDGIDLAVTTENNTYTEAQGVPVKVQVRFDLSRLDNKDIPINATFTWTGATSGSESLIIHNNESLETALINAVNNDEYNSIMRGSVESQMRYVEFTGYAGNTYYITGEIMPITATDIDLSNNKATAKIIIHPTFAPNTDIPNAGDIEDETIVNLTG